MKTKEISLIEGGNQRDTDRARAQKRNADAKKAKGGTATSSSKQAELYVSKIMRLNLFPFFLNTPLYLYYTYLVQLLTLTQEMQKKCD